MEKDFDKWDRCKKRIDARKERDTPFTREGAVWLCSFGLNVGYEQNGMGALYGRPVLVVKKFNNRMYWIVPLPSKQKEYDFYFNFTDQDGNNVSAILAQLRLVSPKRFIREMYIMPEQTLSAICGSLIDFLENRNPVY